MKKLLFIYNPRSGKGLIKGHLSSIVECFAADGYDITVYPTKRAKDAQETVAARAAEFDLIVCSGGDGTLDEVVSGIMASGVERPIGYIPAGSTNDFGNSVGISKHMEKAAQQVVDGRQFDCDLGQFNADYFVYVAAFGMFSDVSYQTSQDLKNVLGHAAYILEGLKRVTTWKTEKLHIESEEYTGDGEFVFGMISNSNSIGGFKGLPGKNVELDDGLFEVTMVRMPQNLAEWQEVLSALVMVQQNAHVLRFKTRHLVITSETPVAWTRDGENGGEHCRVELNNLKEKLHIIVEDSQKLLAD